MGKNIKNSVVATDHSTINNATIENNSDSSYYESSRNATIENSIVSQNGSQITNASINISKEKRKSFWNGFSIGSIIMSVVASAIWYFIQRLIEK